MPKHGATGVNENVTSIDRLLRWQAHSNRTAQVCATAPNPLSCFRVIIVNHLGRGQVGSNDGRLGNLYASISIGPPPIHACHCIPAVANLVLSSAAAGATSRACGGWTQLLGIASHKHMLMHKHYEIFHVFNNMHAKAAQDSKQMLSVKTLELWVGPSAPAQRRQVPICRKVHCNAAWRAKTAKIGLKGLFFCAVDA